MLNKKSNIKPKAKGQIRRPAPASAPQAPKGPSQSSQQSPTQSVAKSPEATQHVSSQEPQPAPPSTTVALVDDTTPVPDNATSHDVATALPVDKESEKSTVLAAFKETESSVPAAAPDVSGDKGSSPEPTPKAPGAISGTQPSLSSKEAQYALKQPPVSPDKAQLTAPATKAHGDGNAGAQEQSIPAKAAVATASISSHVSAPSTEPSISAPDTATSTNPNSSTTTGPLPETDDTQTSVPSADSTATKQTPSTAETAPESTPSSGQPQPTKTKQTRKRKADTSTNGESAEKITAAPQRKRTRIRPVITGDNDETEGSQSAAPRHSRAKRSMSSTATAEAGGNGDAGAKTKRRGSRNRRELTPENSESIEIDVTQIKMADLARDLHIGKKFSLHDELMERERAKRMRYNERRKRLQQGLHDEEINKEGSGSGSSSQGTPANDTNNETPMPQRRTAPIGEQYQIVDGEIVLDHRSLQVDWHARAREQAGEMIEVEENDFTHHTTSATYLRRNLKPQQWTEEETELFYQCLQAFGTDFDTICRLFKGKTRKHIKLKFNREERVNPERVNAALVGKKTVACMSIEDYQQRTGVEYETAEAIYAEQKRAEEEFEARQKALQDEKANEARRRKEEVLAQLNSTVEGENDDAAGRRGRKGKRKAAGIVGL